MVGVKLCHLHVFCTYERAEEFDRWSHGCQSIAAHIASHSERDGGLVFEVRVAAWERAGREVREEREERAGRGGRESPREAARSAEAEEEHVEAEVSKTKRFRILKALGASSPGTATP